MADMSIDKQFYEKGFKSRVTIPEAENALEGYTSGGGMYSKEPGLLEGMNSSPSMKDWDFELEGGGSKYPRAK